MQEGSGLVEVWWALMRPHRGPCSLERGAGTACVSRLEQARRGVSLKTAVRKKKKRQNAGVNGLVLTTTRGHGVPCPALRAKNSTCRPSWLPSRRAEPPYFSRDVPTVPFTCLRWSLRLIVVSHFRQVLDIRQVRFDSCDSDSINLWHLHSQASFAGFALCGM